MATTKAASKKSSSISTRPQKPLPKESDDFESVAKRLECEDDKEAFEKKLGKIAKAKTKNRPLWDITFTKSGSGFAPRPISGQGPRTFPSFPTEEEVRRWLGTHGYVCVDFDNDHWAEDDT
jgi:hypothetical protein